MLADEPSATPPEPEALSVGFMPAMSMALVPVGMLADRIGHRRIFVAGLIGFAASPHSA